MVSGRISFTHVQREELHDVLEGEQRALGAGCVYDTECAGYGLAKARHVMFREAATQGSVAPRAVQNRPDLAEEHVQQAGRHVGQ